MQGFYRDITLNDGRRIGNRDCCQEVRNILADIGLTPQNREEKFEAAGHCHRSLQPSAAIRSMALHVKILTSAVEV